MPVLQNNKKTAEHRQEKRHPLHWPVAIVFDSTDQQHTFHGTTHEISLSGCSILTEHNVFSDLPVSILLSAPIDHPGGRRRVIEVRAQMVYTVLSSGHQRFRCGIHFLKFKGNGRATLTRIVDERGLRAEL